MERCGHAGPLHGAAHAPAAGHCSPEKFASDKTSVRVIWMRATFRVLTNRQGPTNPILIPIPWLKVCRFLVSKCKRIGSKSTSAWQSVAMKDSPIFEPVDVASDHPSISCVKFRRRAYLTLHISCIEFGSLIEFWPGAISATPQPSPQCLTCQLVAGPG